MHSSISTSRGRAAALLGLLLGLSFAGRAQTFPVSAYGFAASQGTFARLLGQGITQTYVNDIQQDENDSRTYPIGFTFLYGGVPCTHFNVTSNGELNLGTATSLFSSTLAPFYDPELNGDSGAASFTVAGTAPNRVLTMEWNLYLSYHFHKS